MRSYLLGIALSAFLLVGCSDEANEVKQKLPEIQVSADMKEGKLFLHGQTNLPENTKLGVKVTKEAIAYLAQDYDVFDPLKGMSWAH